MSIKIKKQVEYGVVRIDQDRALYVVRCGDTYGEWTEVTIVSSSGPDRIGDETTFFTTSIEHRWSEEEEVDVEDGMWVVSYGAQSAVRIIKNGVAYLGDGTRTFEGDEGTFTRRLCDIPEEVTLRD